MPEPLSNERLDTLVLVRLACGRAAKSPPTKSAVYGAVKSIVGDEMRAGVDASIERLVTRGWLLAKPLRVTEEGVRQAAGALGRSDLPPATKWETARNRILVARALGVDAEDARVKDRIGKAENVVGEVLRRAHGTKVRAFPSRNQALDALVWRKLGVETDRPVSVRALREFVLEQLIGASRASFAKRVDVAAGRAMDAPTRTSAADIRDELVARWLAGEPVIRSAARRGDAAPSVPERAAPVPQGPAAPGVPLSDFAKRVDSAARAVPREGRFGEHKVFISAAFAAFDDAAIGLDGFKQRLVEANQEGLLRLARADLVELMPQDQVRASEARHVNASFHFIDLTPRGSAR